MRQEHSELRRTRASLFYLVFYLFPLSVGLLISPTITFHFLGSRAEHASAAWRLFGGLLLVLAMVVVRLIRRRQSESYINTAIGAWHSLSFSVTWWGKLEMQHIC